MGKKIVKFAGNHPWLVLVLVLVISCSIWGARPVGHWLGRHARGVVTGAYALVSGTLQGAF